MSAIFAFAAFRTSFFKKNKNKPLYIPIRESIPSIGVSLHSGVKLQKKLDICTKVTADHSNCYVLYTIWYPFAVTLVKIFRYKILCNFTPLVYSYPDSYSYLFKLASDPF